MDYLTLFVFLLLAWTFLHILITSSFTKPRESSVTNLPPGPIPLPIVGSLFKLGKKPHESLSQLAKAYGPLMSLRLGSLTTVIISSSTMAKEILQKNDQSFSSRTIIDAARALNHHESSIVWLPADSHRYRNLRKLSNSQIFTTQKLDSHQNLRRQKLNDLISFVHQSSVSGSAVDIGQVAFTTILNLISNTFFSIDLTDLNSESARNFKSVVRGVMEEAGKPNLADYFPMLRSIDPQGIRRRMTRYFAEIDEIFDGLIDQKLRYPREMRSSNDLLDMLLDHSSSHENGFDKLGRPEIKSLLKDFFIAGSDTTSSTVEWAMAELLHNPYTMAKARQELTDIIGKDQPVEESDIVRLPYLQGIVKETFRLHPPVPLLLPRKAEIDVNIHDFVVPKNAQILINIWAIGRDPTLWTDPTSFNPERFLELEMNYKGQDFELIPFGSGRRICPGLPLAHRMVHVMLGSLINSFDWKLEVGLKPEDLNMQEKLGLTLQKA